MPIDGVVRGLWLQAAVDKDAEGRSRSTGSPMRSASWRHSGDKLRCKEVWVVGANRYGNPDEDVPADFESQRTPYYRREPAARSGITMVISLLLVALRIVIRFEQQVQLVIRGSL